MKIKSIALLAALLGVLAVSARATTSDAHGKSVAAAGKFEAPSLVKMVSPTGLPRSHIGATVTVKFTVDAAGQPRNINVMWQDNPVLQRSLSSAVSQWQFTPARRNGVAVPVTVEVPLQLEEVRS